MPSASSLADPYKLRTHTLPVPTETYDYTGKIQVDPRLVGGETTEVVIYQGQSLSGNALYGAKYPPTNASKVQNLSIQNGGVYRADDRLLGCDGDGSCHYATIQGDKRIIAGKCARYIAVPISAGGNKVEDWAAGGTLNYRMAVTKARLDALGLTPTRIQWGQGPWNADIPDYTSAQMLAGLKSVIDTWRALGVNCPFYVARESYRAVTPPSVAAVRAGQAAVVGYDANVFAGPDEDAIGNRFDGTHFTVTGGGLQADSWNAVLP